jgi:hypothetical protein
MKGKAWSLEDEGDDEEDESAAASVNAGTAITAVAPTPLLPPPPTPPAIVAAAAAAAAIDLKREVAVARETIMATQTDRRREAMERAAEAAALAAAASANASKVDDDEDDPLDKFMENIAQEVKTFRGNATTFVTMKSSVNTSKAIKTTTIKTNNEVGKRLNVIRIVKYFVCCL